MRDIIPLLIPIVAIVMGIGIGMLAIYLNYRKRKEMFALYHQERMAAIDKGIELPPLPDAFFYDDGKAPSPHGTLLSGLILVFIGVTLFIALYFMVQIRIALFALVPLGIGLALLIYYFAVDRKRAKELEAEKKAKSAAANRVAMT
jgi:hypothetical protein